MEARARQRIFYIWFTALTMMAAFNFYHNISDASNQEVLTKTYAENKDRYEKSIAEHEKYDARINYLMGRVDSLCQDPSNKQQVKQNQP